MKRILFFLVAWIHLFPVYPHAAEAPSSTAGPQGRSPGSNAWSESSEFARVPKHALKQISMSSVAVTNVENLQFILADEFVKVFKLTPSEVERVTAAIADAMHRYRMAEGKQLEPTTEETSLPGPRQNEDRALEKFDFRLIPFPEKAAAIRQKLEEDVRTVLGNQRAEFFWENGRVMLDSEMKPFNAVTPMPPGRTRTTFITYELRDVKPAPDIYVFRTTLIREIDRRGGGGSRDGRPTGESLDQYAPDSIKPALAQWRREIAKSNPIGGTELARQTPPTNATITSATAFRASDAKPDFSRWNDDDQYVELPKTLIKSLKVPGLNLEGDLMPETLDFLGLTPSEAEAVLQLYEVFKNRFEKVERAHFERIERGKNIFLLKAFPDESNALGREWIEKLKMLVGLTRAEILEQSIRTSMGPAQDMRQGIAPFANRLFGLPNSGMTWLERGKSEIQLNVTLSPTLGARAMIRIEYQIQGRRFPWFGPRDQIPRCWRHLLTPDLLDGPIGL